MAEEKQHLTQAGYDRLIKELAELNDIKLPDIIKKLTEASEQGDISENAEYDDALARRDLLKARISEIELLLENVEIIKKGTGKVKEVVGY
jgi:transcription elongation factor GreA